MKLIYILYDGLNNAVFAGQVWGLLLQKITQQPALQITLISFERGIIKHNYKHANIKIMQIKRNRYFGKFSLFLDFLKLKKQINAYITVPDEMIARGPFAGWIALKLFNHCKKPRLIIQARGLAAEEYAYTHQTSNFLTQFLVKLRYLQLFNLEKQVYNTPIKTNITIECVSTALQAYLIITYQANPLILTIAQADLPKQISASQLATWRKMFRTQFQLTPQTIIYCYSGSSHKWQCPNQTITFFADLFKQNQAIFLLILTPQVTFFKNLIQTHDLPDSCYLVLSVSHQEIYQYLAMADFGLILREKHILNWVCRPTKALEYQSAGLQIIHNNTVEWLIKKYNSGISSA
jgi:hypothetical protein